MTTTHAQPCFGRPALDRAIRCALCQWEMSAKKRVNAGGASTAPAEAPAAAPVEVKDLNPVTTEFEFMGPYLGSLGVSFGLPVLVWAASYYCNNIGWPSIPKALPTLADVRACFSLEALAVYVGWWAFQAALYMLVPGDVIDGTQLRDGKVLKYRINGEWRSGR